MNGSIIVTGSASGIGHSCYDFLKKKGFSVIGLDKSSSSDYQVDVSSEQEVKSFFQKIESDNIKIDGIVNNAAVQVEKKIVDLELVELDRVLDTNIKSIFLITKYALPYMKASSSIVNISSVHAHLTSPGMASYVASKGAVSSLTRAMALELAERKVRVNSVLPGAIETQMLKKGLTRNGSYVDSLEKLVRATPLQRLGLPEDIAKLVYFLIDESQSSFITGQEFICDGGVSAKLASE